MNCILKTIIEKGRDIKLIFNKRHYKIEDNQDPDSSNIYYINEETAQHAFDKKLEDMKGTS
jgi:hypothetical protein